ncbi:helix-turn-helix domain-containing protein [Caldibacillus thermolactis]|uniref:Helix-turn-helix domain-containing protein n=1 Tax=Pallidibacillus thermolactis TaxID=251051 RepID=A0ABT2WLZ9_9BACI|nr:helix-turn-helix domain-containing protein [Pallidibacillus thermolactis]MCU9595724.1 helix-turn-helix domain-containing protein [Pallidibacillus thermolactis]
MNFLTVMILYCISQFKGERSINAVFYLIQGKKSSQTIQDAIWYSLSHVFSIYPDLKKEQFQEQMKKLVMLQYIILDKKTVQITELGEKNLRQSLEKYPIPAELDGWTYKDIDQKFWQRLSLIVQIVSNLGNGDSKFMPVQRDFYTQKWVKQWLYTWNTKYNKQILSKKLYHELEQILSQFERKKKNPNLFVARLSGYQQPGLTISQIANIYDMDEYYYLVVFRSIIHYMITIISEQPQKYPLLYSLIKNEKREIVLTESTRKTLHLIKMDKSIKEIAKIRKLKESTIEDHIVEITLMDPTFHIERFVNPAIQERIRTAIKKLNTRKLKRIKEEVSNADYFSIRLVLSKWSDRK